MRSSIRAIRAIRVIRARRARDDGREINAVDAGVERGGGQVGEDDEGKGSRPAPSRCTQPTHNKHEQAAVWESSRALDWHRNHNVSHSGELWRARNNRAAFSLTHTRFAVGFNMAVWPLGKESSQGPAATAATYAPHDIHQTLYLSSTYPETWKSFVITYLINGSPLFTGILSKNTSTTSWTLGRTALSPCLLVWLVGVMAVVECAPPYHSLTLTRASASARFAYATNADAARSTSSTHLRIRTLISRTNIVSVPRTEFYRHLPQVSYNRMAFRVHDHLGSRN